MSEVTATGRTTAQAKADLSGLLKKLQALLDMADDPRTPEHEAASARSKAESIMKKYKIDQEALIAADPVSVEPIWESVVVAKASSPFYSKYLDLFYSITRHVGVRARYVWVGSDLTAQVVGYEADVRYAEMLYASARLTFQEKLEPSIRPELSDAENCYRLRSAGIERNKIARMLWGLDTHAAHAKVGALYKEACLARGEDPALNGRTINAKTFRKSYAKNFVDSFWMLLSRARNAADSNGGALVLHGRQERVDEAFYARFPEMRPSQELAKPEPCELCAKKKDGKKCRDHTERKWTQADQARWERENYSASALAGKVAGQDAAEQVELDRVARAKRLGEDSTRTGVRNLTGLELEG